MTRAEMRELVKVDPDGTPVFVCTVCHTEYAGHRDCPRCQCEQLISLDDAEALGLRPRDPEVA
jgi:predicted metal-binding protein